MNIKDYMKIPGELPLDNIKDDGGFCGIFRKIACVGDSLSSGEFESTNEDGSKGYHDMFEYSWGQYLARMCGSEIYNFSRGGMTAEEYCERFSEDNDFWNPEKRCQCYIIALGTNDIHKNKMDLGTPDDIDAIDYRNNKKTFCGYYGEIISRYKKIQPDAKFFLVTLPKYTNDEEVNEKNRHADYMYRIADLFDNTYVLDIRKYAPERDEEYKKYFKLGGHMNPMGYMIDAKIIASYIDYIIRNNPIDFSQVGFIGKPWKNRV